MLITGIYNPPKHKYKDADLMSYVVELVDFQLDKHPNTLVLCGGDLNRLDMHDSELCQDGMPWLTFQLAVMCV